MKKYILTTIACLALGNANAATFFSTNTINRLGSIESRADGDFIVIKDFKQAGDCPLSNGLVVARFHSGEVGSRSFSIALAAKMAGKKVKLTVDDADKNANGSCYVLSVEISE